MSNSHSVYHVCLYLNGHTHKSSAVHITTLTSVTSASHVCAIIELAVMKWWYIVEKGESKLCPTQTVYTVCLVSQNSCKRSIRQSQHKHGRVGKIMQCHAGCRDDKYIGCSILKGFSGHVHA